MLGSQTSRSGRTNDEKGMEKKENKDEIGNKID